MNIPLQPVSSRHIAGVGFDPATGTMSVQFRSGLTYQHSGVSTDQHQAFLSARSKGSHYAKVFRNKFNPKKQ